jgi:hypothetical protein
MAVRVFSAPRYHPSGHGLNDRDRTNGSKGDDITTGDLELLKQLRAAGERGRNVRELNVRVSLDRLVKGGYLGGSVNRSRLRPISDHPAGHYSRVRFVTVHRRFSPPPSVTGRMTSMYKRVGACWQMARSASSPRQE